MKKVDNEKLNPVCSFCGKNHSQVEQLIQGNVEGTYICDECIELCHEIVLDSEKKELEKNVKKNVKSLLPKPVDIKHFLDEYIIGQDEAKKAISVAVYNHYKRINNVDTDVEIQKSNLLFIGPTGSGKTYMAEILAKFLGVPFAIADATCLTEAGYVGEDVESILLRLITAANGDIAMAEKGIVYVDEIDKITKKSENMSITRDVSGEGVQQGLLKIMEGCIANVPPKGGRKHPEQPLIQINTKNILFICGGSFQGLEKIIERRLNKGSIGFNAEINKKEEILYDEYIDKCAIEDLIEFGLIPEFIGRLPVIAPLKTLDIEAMKKILIIPKNALIKQYKKLFDIDDIDIEFDDSALNAIARKAYDRKLGARGLRAILEETMQTIMYDAPSIEGLKKIIINEEVINNNVKPLYVFVEEKEKAA